jgi:hypothetical protein
MSAQDRGKNLGPTLEERAGLSFAQAASAVQAFGFMWSCESGHADVNRPKL